MGVGVVVVVVVAVAVARRSHEVRPYMALSERSETEGLGYQGTSGPQDQRTRRPED